MKESANSYRHESRLWSFFRRPWVGIAGFLTGLISVALAILFYVQGVQYRDLCYYVHPVKSIVAAANQTSRLGITLDDKPITGSITAAQIAFWNAGDESIRPEHVLSGMVIHTGNFAPIIEARIRKKSRGIVDIKLDNSEINKGAIGISWNILEKHDGGIIEIVFAGGINTEIEAKAVIEGQRKISVLESSQVFKSPAEQYTRFIGTNRRLGYVVLGFGFFMAVLSVVVAVIGLREGRSLNKHFARIPLIAVATICMGIYIFLRKPPGPPFGF